MRNLRIIVITIAASWILVQADAESQIAAKVEPWLDVSDRVVLYDSIVHPYLPSYSSMIVQCFEDEGLLSLLKEGKAKVIVHHGAPINSDNYTWIYSHTETLPFFVNKGSGVEILNTRDAAAVLSGEVNNWKNLGGNDVDIQIYGPKATLNNHALLRIMREVHGKSVDIDFFDVGDYKFMGEMVNKEKGAIAVGLRSKHALPDKLPNVNVLLPVTANGAPAYSIPIFIYVKRQDKDARVVASDLFELINERAKEDGQSYPLDDRLDNLHAY